MDEKRTSEASAHEIKFVFSNSAAHLFIQWLRSRCFPDPVFPASIVSSIYYDTPSLRSLQEKINSDYIKTKIRLRWYSDIETRVPEDKSFLEAKHKVGWRREKIRLETDLAGEWLSRVNLDNQMLKTIPQKFLSENILIRRHIFPVFDICYKRYRFVEPTTGARLCVDYDICTSRINWEILPEVPPFRLRTAVFEQKGKLRQLPEVLRQLTALGARKHSFSKYIVCYEKIIRVMY
jgi:SPX domain protein involved in polyphosphate accumulation